MPIHQVYPENYQTQLDEKAQRTVQEFARFSPPTLEVFESPTSHFRMRAEFKIWHSGDGAHYAMFEPGQSKKPFIVEDFPVANQLINRLMPELLQAVNQTSCLSERLFQAEFLTATTGDAVVTLIYHRPLGDEWLEAAQALADKLNINLIGRSRKQKLVVGRDYVTECFSVDGYRYQYRQVEAAFSQPNAAVCQEMLKWAAGLARPLEGDLLELYCGNGNFTLPLARQFVRVLATEISKSSVATAEHNIAENQINNIKIARMSSEEFTQALAGVREFRRLQGIELQSYQFSTLFVDPPRAGLDAGTLELAARFEHIIYISCNPATLSRDLEQLHATHELKRLALFDQFPYTDHRECGVLLSRRYN